METLSSFPTVDDSLVKKLNPQFTPPRFYWVDDNHVERDLVAEDVSANIHSISDEYCCWSPDERGFGIERSIIIRFASFLFGMAGVACNNAVLSLALVWMSKDSHQRSSIEIGEVVNKPDAQSFQYRKYFPKPRFRGRVDFNVVLILKKAGQPSSGEEHLANIAGTVLGTLDKYSVLFDGSGSSFPIMTVTEKDGLLWSVKCDFVDPLIERLTDSVAIHLNNAHKDYKYINTASDKFNPGYLREVLSAALTDIVNYARQNKDSWDDIKNGKGEEESVALAINYFADTLELNLDDPIKCSTSFRDWFEKNMNIR